jgi:DNA-directed RNA polymerase specialized sigma24 family protein
VPKSPPHREIARILGIPKGSVDSCFYYLKRYTG